MASSFFSQKHQRRPQQQRRAKMPGSFSSFVLGGIPRLFLQPTPICLFLLLLVCPTTLVYSQQSHDGVTPHPGLTIDPYTFPKDLFLEPADWDTNATLPAIGSFRSDLCEASYRVSVTRDVTLGRALEGRRIRTALFDAGGFTKFDYDSQGQPYRLNADYPGLIPLLLDALCERAGCTWRDSYAIVPLALSANQTFTDLLLWTTNVYDLSALFWAPSVARLQAGITFTAAWYDGSIIMIAPRAPPGEEIFDPWGWLAPFDGAVWITIMVTLLFSTLVHWLIEVFLADFENTENDNLQEKEDWWARLRPWESLWLFATAFAGQFEFAPTSGPGYLFTFSVAFWALLMGASYTANLASFLVIRNRAPLPVNTVEEAIQRNKRICARRGTQMDISVTQQYPVYAASGKFVRLDQQSVEGLRPDPKPLCDIALTGVARWSVLQRSARYNGACDLEWIGRPFESIPASFGVRSDAGSLCTSLLRDVFNVHFLDMQSAGIIDELWEDHIERSASIDCAAPDDDDGSSSTTAPPSSRRRQLFSHHKKGVPPHSEPTVLDDEWWQEPQSSVSTIAPTTKWYDLQQEREEISLRGADHSTSPSWEGHHSKDERRLKTAGRRGVSVDPAVVNGSSDSSKLSLTNMGGVFLLHGILSMLAVALATVSWARKRGYFASFGGLKNKKNDSPKNVDTPTENEDRSDESNLVMSGGNGDAPTTCRSSFSRRLQQPPQRHYQSKQSIRRSIKLEQQRTRHHSINGGMSQQFVLHNDNCDSTTTAVATLQALKMDMIARLETAFEEQMVALSQNNNDPDILVAPDQQDPLISPSSLFPASRAAPDCCDEQQQQQ